MVLFNGPAPLRDDLAELPASDLHAEGVVWLRVAYGTLTPLAVKRNPLLQAPAPGFTSGITAGVTAIANQCSSGLASSIPLQWAVGLALPPNMPKCDQQPSLPRGTVASRPGSARGGTSITPCASTSATASSDGLSSDESTGGREGGHTSPARKRPRPGHVTDHAKLKEEEPPYPPHLAPALAPALAPVTADVNSWKEVNSWMEPLEVGADGALAGEGGAVGGDVGGAVGDVGGDVGGDVAGGCLDELDDHLGGYLDEALYGEDMALLWDGLQRDSQPPVPALSTELESWSMSRAAASDAVAQVSSAGGAAAIEPAIGRGAYQTFVQGPSWVTPPPEADPLLSLCRPVEEAYAGAASGHALAPEMDGQASSMERDADGGADHCGAGPGMLHRPCVQCRAAKVRCKRQDPCPRCVRLGLKCELPPDVKRGRPSHLDRAAAFAHTQREVAHAPQLAMVGGTPKVGSTPQLIFPMPSSLHQAVSLPTAQAVRMLPHTLAYPLAPTHPLAASVSSTPACAQAPIQSCSQVPLSPPTSPPSALDQPIISTTANLNPHAAAAPPARARRHWRMTRVAVALFLLVALQCYAYSYATSHTPSQLSPSTLIPAQPTDQNVSVSLEIGPPAGGSFLVLLSAAAFTMTAAIFPGAPPAWSMPYVHAVGFVMVAGKAHTTLQRFHAVAAEYAGESDASLAVRRMCLIASFLATLLRTLTAAEQTFWYGARGMAISNALIILVVVGTLWWIEGPSAYPPLDNSAPEGVVLACSLACFAGAFNPKTRRRVASAVRWSSVTDVAPTRSRTTG